MNARLDVAPLVPTRTECSTLTELRLRALMLSLPVMQAQELAPARSRYWPSEIYSSLAEGWQTVEAARQFPLEGGLDALFNELRGLGSEVRPSRLARLLFDVLASMPKTDHVLAQRLIREVDLMVYREFVSLTQK